METIITAQDILLDEIMKDLEHLKVQLNQITVVEDVGYLKGYVAGCLQKYMMIRKPSLVVKK